MRGSLCIAVAVVLLGGCSTTEGIKSLGGGQYLVTGRGTIGGYEFANEEAKSRAEEFCQKEGRSMEVVNMEHDADPTGVFSRLTFECN